MNFGGAVSLGCAHANASRSGGNGAGSITTDTQTQDKAGQGGGGCKAGVMFPLKCAGITAPQDRGQIGGNRFDWCQRYLGMGCVLAIAED